MEPSESVRERGLSEQGGLEVESQTEEAASGGAASEAEGGEHGVVAEEEGEVRHAEAAEPRTHEPIELGEESHIESGEKEIPTEYDMEKLEHIYRELWPEMSESVFHHLHHHHEIESDHEEDSSSDQEREDEDGDGHHSRKHRKGLHTD